MSCGHSPVSLLCMNTLDFLSKLYLHIVQALSNMGITDLDQNPSLLRRKHPTNVFSGYDGGIFVVTASISRGRRSRTGDVNGEVFA